MTTPPTSPSEPTPTPSLPPSPLLPFPQSIGEQAYSLAGVSVVFGMLFGLFAGVESLLTTGWPQGPLISASLVILDPYLLQGIAAGHCVLCLLAWQNSLPSRPTISRRAVAFLLFGILLAIFYVANDLVFKVTFDRPRPPIDGRLDVGFIAKHISSSSNGAPSGFASRGMYLLLTSSLATIGLRKNASVSSASTAFHRWYTQPRYAITLQLFLALGASVARVLTGYHYWFDVVLGWSLGIFLFWLGVLLLGASNRRPEDDNELIAITFSALIALSVIGFAYCRSAEEWAPTVLVTLIAAAVITRPTSRHAL